MTNTTHTPEEAKGLLSGSIETVIDESAGTITYNIAAGAKPATAGR